MNRELDMFPQIRECNEIQVVKADVMQSEASPRRDGVCGPNVESEITLGENICPHFIDALEGPGN